MLRAGQQQQPQSAVSIHLWMPTATLCHSCTLGEEMIWFLLDVQGIHWQTQIMFILGLTTDGSVWEANLGPNWKFPLHICSVDIQHSYWTHSHMSTCRHTYIILYIQYLCVCVWDLEYPSRRHHTWSGSCYHNAAHQPPIIMKGLKTQVEANYIMGCKQCSSGWSYLFSADSACKWSKMN